MLVHYHSPHNLEVPNTMMMDHVWSKDKSGAGSGEGDIWVSRASADGRGPSVMMKHRITDRTPLCAEDRRSVFVSLNTRREAKESDALRRTERVVRVVWEKEFLTLLDLRSWGHSWSSWVWFPGFCLPFQAFTGLFRS